MPIAQFNIAVARWPLDDPRMAEFMDNVDRIHDIAARTPGFIWRMEDEHGPDAPKWPDIPLMTFTLTVWEDIESLRQFTWKTLHKRFRLRRQDWFEPWLRPYLVIWEVPEGHFPKGPEALAMLDKLEREGPSETICGVEALAREIA